MTVKEIQGKYNRMLCIPDLIASVFVIWSLASASEHCHTPRRPLPAQVVAIVRLLVLDKPVSNGGSKFERGMYWVQSLFLSPSPAAIDASYLAQIKTGQGKSVVLGVLATVLSIVGFK